MFNVICWWCEILWGKETVNLWLTCHVEDAVAGADMREEGISQALTSMSTFHQASNVNDIKERWDFAGSKSKKGN